MNPTNPEAPKQLPNLDIRKKSIDPEKIIALQRLEINNQRGIIERVTALNKALAVSVQELNQLLKEFEQEIESAESKISEEKMKRLLEATRLTEDFQAKVEHLQKDMESSERRAFTLEKRLEESHAHGNEVEEVSNEKGRLIINFKEVIKKYEETVKIKDSVLKHIIERYRKDVGTLNREIKYHIRGGQYPEHTNAVGALMERNLEIKELQLQLAHLKQTTENRKSPPPLDIEITDTGDVRQLNEHRKAPTPLDIEITDTGDVRARVNLSEVPMATEKKTSILSRAFSGVKKFFDGI